MSVRIVEESAQKQQGWRVSRRAFLAQSTALLVALGVPVNQAKAIAGKLYQTGQAGTINGFVDEAIFSVSSRLTHGFDSDEHASIQLVVKKMYQEAGLADFGVEVDFTDNAIASARVSDLAHGRSLDEITVGEVLGQAVAPQVSAELDRTIVAALDTLKQKQTLPASVQSLLTDGFSAQALQAQTGTADAHDPMRIFTDTESAVIQRLLAGLPRSGRSVEAKLPAPLGQDVSIPLAEQGEQVRKTLAKAAGEGWMSAVFADSEYTSAREIAQKLSNEAAKIPAIDRVGSEFVRAALDGVDLVNTVLAKSAEITVNPSELLQKIEGRLDSAQTELTEQLDRFESLSTQLSGFPLQFAEKVPEQRYILSDAGGGADEVLAQEMVKELNTHHKRATDLAQEIVNLQIQVEDLSVDAYDEELFGGKFAELSQRVEDSVQGLRSVVSALQSLEPELSTVNADSYRVALQDAVYAVHEHLETNKPAAAFDMSPREWALTKAYAAQMLIQRAQLDAVMTEVSGIDTTRPALVEALGVYGRWTGHAPIDALGAIAQEQLNTRTSEAAREVATLLQGVMAASGQAIGSSDAATRTQRYGQVVGAHLAALDPAFEQPLSAVAGAGATVAELVGSLNGKAARIASGASINGIASDAAAAVVSGAISQAIHAAAQGQEALKESVGKMSPAEIGATSIHYLAFEVAKSYLKAPISESLKNYCNTLLHGALVADTVDLAAWDKVSGELASAASASTAQKSARLDAAKPGLAQATATVSDLLAAHVVPAIGAQVHNVVAQQAPRALGIELS